MELSKKFKDVYTKLNHLEDVSILKKSNQERKEEYIEIQKKIVEGEEKEVIEAKENVKEIEKDKEKEKDRKQNGMGLFSTEIRI